jgi:hypothetical protein
MEFKATFNNISVISWRSVLLMEETELPGENNRPWGKGQSTNYKSETSVKHCVFIDIAVILNLIYDNNLKNE